MEGEEVCSKRDLDDKGLGQSKVLCSFSGVKLPMVNYHAGFLALPAPERQISNYPPAFGSRRTTLTWTPPCRLFLVAFSLSPRLARLLAHLGVLLSASCRSLLFPLERLSGLDYWPSHRWCGIDCRKIRRRLVKMVLVERGDDLFKVLDR